MNDANNANDRESLHKNNTKADTIGMIFMCSSKTKSDCYKYKVFGLPAAKKDIVLKIYKGMWLFLFDFDLKLLYGIYKAAEPGGYNIEPKAFKSEFPSQAKAERMKARTQEKLTNKLAATKIVQITTQMQKRANAEANIE
ncbi:hypothetical protein ACFE04_022127 [Oxalis oulophora]